MNREKWIEEQENDELFRPVGTGTDADHLLEKSPTNRDITQEQGKLLVVARMFDISLFPDGKSGIYTRLCDMVETTQMSIDNQARRDFMKVVIEQWQGKLANMKRSAIESLL